MAIKTFFLLGDDPVKDNQCVEVDVHGELQAVREQVAAQFSVCEPSGIDFQHNGDPIDDIEGILEIAEPIAVTIDGNPVREFPMRPGKPLVGTFYETFPDHLSNHQRAFERLGPCFKETNMGRTMHFSNDPRIAVIAFNESQYFSKALTENHPLFPVKDNTAGLFTGDTDTEEWHMAHRLMPAALSPKAIRRHVHTIQGAVESSYPVFDEIDRDNEAVHAYQYMLKIAAQAVGKALMDVDFHHFDTKDAPLHPIVRGVSQLLLLNRKIALYGTWYRKLPFGEPKELHDTRIATFKLIYEGVSKIPKTGTDMPMAEAALKAKTLYEYMNTAVGPNGEKIPDKNKVPIMSIVAGAGFSTTASSLSWLIYAVCNPDHGNVQERLIQEMVDHGITDETEWTTDILNDLSYLDKFTKETMRLFAPNSQPARTCRKTCVLPDGYRIHSGSVINANPYHIHINPKVWSNPTRFDPDRWDTDEAKKRHRCAYIPFAYGPRQCIGFNFALQEIRLVIALLVFRYEIMLADDTPMVLDPNFVPPRPLNLYLRMKRRTRLPNKSPTAPPTIPEGLPPVTNGKAAEEAPVSVEPTAVEPTAA